MFLSVLYSTLPAFTSLIAFAISFGKEKLSDNLKALITAIVKAKPASAKGKYLRSITIASTMGPGVKLSSARAMDLVEK